MVAVGIYDVKSAFGIFLGNQNLLVRNLQELLLHESPVFLTGQNEINGDICEQKLIEVPGNVYGHVLRGHLHKINSIKR